MLFAVGIDFCYSFFFLQTLFVELSKMMTSVLRVEAPH